MPTPRTSTAARHPRLATALLLSGAILAACALGEFLVRTMIHRDADGQEWLRELRLRPRRLPLTTIGDALASLATHETFLGWDPDLGWAPHPHARSRDGSQRVDGGGIRTDGETSRVAAEGVLRIATFGDSFTFGDEVGQDETWAVALERALAARDVAAEVLNFGVNAYGTDQAFLRWQRDGRGYAPAVVILGFQPEDALRNVNVFRPVYFEDSQVPLSKPRFVGHDGALVLVNVPTIPPEQLLAVLAAIEREPLLAYEGYFGPYTRRWWMASKAAALAITVAGARTNPFVLTDEVRETTARIVAAFASQVREDGAAFLLAHLPRREDLATLRAGREPWYAALLRELQAQYEVVEPLPASVADEDAMFAPHGHYSATLQGIVGAALAEPVVRLAARP